MINTRIPRGSLEDAFLRCERASLLIDELAKLLEDYELQEKGHVFAELDHETKIAKLGFSQPATPPPKIASAIIGEIIYNLRATLDYLVFILALMDSKQPQQQTQFPIVANRKDFSGQVKRHLKGVSPEHITEIEKLQPFVGCTWTGDLRDLSNPDKHRHLATLAGMGSYVFRIKRTKEGFETEFEPSVVVAFDDQRPVIETLRHLHDEVLGVLNRFSTE